MSRSSQVNRIIKEIIDNIVGVFFLTLGIILMIIGDYKFQLLGLCLMSFGGGFIAGSETERLRP